MKLYELAVGLTYAWPYVVSTLPPVHTDPRCDFSSNPKLLTPSAIQVARSVLGRGWSTCLWLLLQLLLAKLCLGDGRRSALGAARWALRAARTLLFSAAGSNLVCGGCAALTIWMVLNPKAAGLHGSGLVDEDAEHGSAALVTEDPCCPVLK